jgi:hypothetical protein
MASGSTRFCDMVNVPRRPRPLTRNAREAFDCADLARGVMHTDADGFLRFRTVGL